MSRVNWNRLWSRDEFKEFDRISLETIVKKIENSIEFLENSRSNLSGSSNVP